MCSVLICSFLSVEVDFPLCYALVTIFYGTSRNKEYAIISFSTIFLCLFVDLNVPSLKSGKNSWRTRRNSITYSHWQFGTKCLYVFQYWKNLKGTLHRWRTQVLKNLVFKQIVFSDIQFLWDTIGKIPGKQILLCTSYFWHTSHRWW